MEAKEVRKKVKALIAACDGCVIVANGLDREIEYAGDGVVVSDMLEDVTKALTDAIETLESVDDELEGIEGEL